VEARRGEVLLHGEIPDQAALHGILDRIEELGLQLLEVRRLPDDLSGAVPVGTMGP
jgi:hypothetical protein